MVENKSHIERPSFAGRLMLHGERVVVKLSLVANYIGTTVLGLLILFVAFDVIGRYILNRPIKGDFELIVLATGIIASLGLADALVHDGHIRIDILTSRFPKNVRSILDFFANLFGFVLWGIVTWRVIIYGLTLKNSKSISGLLPIPVYPFAFIVAFGCVTLCLVFLVKLVYSVAEVIKK